MDVSFAYNVTGVAEDAASHVYVAEWLQSFSLLYGIDVEVLDITSVFMTGDILTVIVSARLPQSFILPDIPVS